MSLGLYASYNEVPGHVLAGGVGAGGGGRGKEVLVEDLSFVLEGCGSHDVDDARSFLWESFSYCVQQGLGVLFFHRSVSVFRGGFSCSAEVGVAGFIACVFVSGSCLEVSEVLFLILDISARSGFHHGLDHFVMRRVEMDYLRAYVMVSKHLLQSYSQAIF